MFNTVWSKFLIQRLACFPFVSVYFCLFKRDWNARIRVNLVKSTAEIYDVRAKIVVKKTKESGSCDLLSSLTRRKYWEMSKWNDNKKK